MRQLIGENGDTEVLRRAFEMMGKISQGHERKSETSDTSATTALMKRLGIDVGDTTMAPKKGLVSMGGPKLETNAFALTPKDRTLVFRYVVTMHAVVPSRGEAAAAGEERRIELTKKTNGDFIIVDRRDRCRDVFEAAVRDHPILRGKRVFYDLQSILYSLDALDPNTTPFIIKIGTHQLTGECGRFKEVVMSIEIPRDSHVIDISKMDVVNNDSLEAQGRELLQFFDIITAQHPMFTPLVHTTFSAHTSYLNEGHWEEYGFHEADLGTFHNRSHLRPGAQKGTRFVQDIEGLASAAVVVEAKKTPFHIAGGVLDKARSLVNLDRTPLSIDDMAALRSGLKGLYVETTHSKSKQMFFIRDVVRENAHQIRFTTSTGEEVSVFTYFDKTYFRLHSPLSPLIVAKSSGPQGGGPRYFPMEVLKICPNQRVKAAQQTPQMVQAAIKKCAIPPIHLMDNIMRTVDSIQLTKGNYVKQANCRVDKEPIKAHCGQLGAPTILYGNGSNVRVRTDNFTWNTGRHQFHTAVEIKKWGALAFVDHRDTDWRNFIDRFIEQCRVQGIRINQPDHFGTHKPEDVEVAINKLAESDFEFVLALHSDFDRPIHENLKLAERRCLVVTQAIRRQTMLNVVGKNQWQTMQNIVAKTNVKMGGMDYILAEPTARAYQLLGKGDLFIGIAVNHPFGGVGGAGAEPATDRPSSFGEKRSSCGVPSVVGYSANCGKSNDFEFIGDFIFQNPDREVRSTLVPDIVKRCVEKFRATCNANPQRIFVFRSGHSEGYYSKILMFDVPLVKHALREIGCGSPLTMIVVNKLQNVRFFRQDAHPQSRAADQNVQPGTVVDSCVVHPVFQEFFLTSHRALQGTSRTPKYTVLIDESQCDIGELEMISYQLCYGHQIVNMPTSLPSPLFIANRYAERGRKIYNAISRDVGSDMPPGDLSALSYDGVPWLGEWRINA